MPRGQVECPQPCPPKHVGRICPCIAAAFWGSTLVVATVHGDVGGADPGRDDMAVEEVRVTGERVVELSLDERREIYRQLAQGRRLYSDSQYKRAFPFLLNTAKHGFKDAQARVGYIYLNGLGEVARDSTVAVGWFGVAASGNSSPDIRNYFNDLWNRIPEEHVPYFREVVEEYKSKYGEHANRVTCDLHRPVHSFVKRLACYFEMDQRLMDELGPLFMEHSMSPPSTESSSRPPPDDDSDFDSD